MKKFSDNPEEDNKLRKNYNLYMSFTMQERRKKSKESESNNSNSEAIIKKEKEVLTNIKRYHLDFPGEEFNEKVSEILKNNNLPIKERTLKDIIMWDILDKKGLLSPERIVRILNYNSSWEKPIENFMHEKKYICVESNGERIYIPNPQTEQK